MKIAARVLFVAAAASLVLACSRSPKSICNDATSDLDEPKQGIERGKCLAMLERSKRYPSEYKCIDKCVGTKPKMSALEKCSDQCETGKSGTGGGNDNAQASDFTPGMVQTALNQKYGARYSLLEQKDTPTGWVGTAMIGEVRGSDEIDVVKLLLVDTKNANEARALSSSLEAKASGPSKGVPGTKKLLFVSCVRHRDRLYTGLPTKSCPSNSRIAEEIADAVSLN